jgi:hypothetical protein
MKPVSSNMPHEMARAREVLDAIEARTTTGMALAVNALAKILVATWVSRMSKAEASQAVVDEAQRCRNAGLPLPSGSDIMNVARAAIQDIKDEHARRQKPSA